MKTFNKKGDKGDTSLLFGRRIPKSDLRCEAYGTIDEAVSFLGLARNFVRRDRVKDIILNVQKELFTVNAEIACPLEDYAQFTARFTSLDANSVSGLEKTIDDLEAEIEMPKAFIIPGANRGSAALDVARTIVRRAERQLVRLKEANEIKNELLLPYLNRLADLLFTLARYEERPG